jgi:hypothetical protein
MRLPTLRVNGGRFLSMKSLRYLGMIALAAATLHGQQYWSTTPPDCSGLESVTISTSPPEYACGVSGTFVWYASGGSQWTSYIRVGAPSTAPIQANYYFYDKSGNPISLDYTIGVGGAISSGSTPSIVLNTNQPVELDILGATSNAPAYNTLQDGSVWAQFLCPDATTCSNVLPQLVYTSALVQSPWSLSVPIAWDDEVWPTYSAEGVDDEKSHIISFVVYNEGSTATAFTVYVYDSSGNLVATGTTPTIPPPGADGQAGTYATALSGVIPADKIPSGVFKVLFDGGPGGEDCAVEVLQFSGVSATSLQVAYDSPPSGDVNASAINRAAHRAARTAAAQQRVQNAISLKAQAK